jgi:hypothetical protein
VLLAVIVAQTVQAQSTADPDLDRIRKALAQPPAIAVPAPAPTREGPVFRVTVEGQYKLKPAWGEWHNVPGYVRPPAPTYHFEFLDQVTKNRERAEEFRGATLYPAGIDVVQVVQFLAKHIRAANRKGQEANAKEEVRKALEELLACRADPHRPGC